MTGDLGDVLIRELDLCPAVSGAHDEIDVGRADACHRKGVLVDLVGRALGVRRAGPDDLPARLPVV